MSKIVFNISFTSKKPPSYLSGADRAEYIASRKFYDMTAKFNYLKYMLDEKKVEKNKDALDYYTRSGTNTGLFNMDGKMSEEQIGELKEKLAKTESIIWHGFISFDEETTKGFLTQEKAIKFMKQSFNSFIERTHLNPKNVETFAALHTDTAHHHHIHFSFFEKEAKHRDKNGKLSYTQKGSINSGAIDNYLVSANMHLSENSYDYYSARDRAMNKLKSLKAASVLAYAENGLKTSINTLKHKLPKTGRLQYNSANMAKFRDEIDTVANMLIRSNPEAYRLHLEMQKQLAAKEQEVIALARDNKLAYINGKRLTKAQIKEVLEKGKTKYISEKYIDLSKVDYIDKLRLDYKERAGNKVLGLIKEMDKDYRQTRRAKVNDKQLKIEARRRSKSSGMVLQLVIKSLNEYQKNVKADFSKSLKQIEQEMQNENSGA